MGSVNGLRHTETRAMTRILTLSSGSATPNSECRACAAHGFSGADNSDMKGVRISPSKEMLAAPRKKAVQTLSGGPGRSPAATTSHRISSAGATAAVPITVGRDSSRFICAADRPFFGPGYVARVMTFRRMRGPRQSIVFRVLLYFRARPINFKQDPSAIALQFLARSVGSVAVQLTSG